MSTHQSMPSLDSICKKLSFVLMDYPNPLGEHDVKGGGHPHNHHVFIRQDFRVLVLGGCWL